ncbi:MAG: hypothetical protein JXL80_14560 [Planctomycetes bacterium]|nr:hypothetical protein [Planctomycetota bacterium]
MTRTAILSIVLLSLLAALMTMRMLNGSGPAEGQAAWAENSEQGPINQTPCESQGIDNKDLTNQGRAQN